MSQRVLFTGTGRCGTALVTDVLRTYWSDYTHQGIQHRHLNGDALLFLAGSRADVGVDGDVSFEAAPIAQHLRRLGWRIVWIDRNPADVALSWIRIGAFTDDHRNTHIDWWKSIERSLPWLAASWADLDEFNRAVTWCHGWRRLVGDAADLTLNFETMTVRDVLTAAARHHPSVIGSAPDSVALTKGGWARVDWGTPAAG